METNDLQQLFIYVLLQYRDGNAVEPELNPIVNKLVRRGYLGKSVTTGVITLSDYGLKVLSKLGA